jgi:hypothetical protein
VFHVHKFTDGDNRLVSADGTVGQRESAGIVSSHATAEEAQREVGRLSRMGNGINAGKYGIRTDDGAPVWFG